jgi:phosphoserine phosphatase
MKAPRHPGTAFIFVRHGQTVWNAQGRWQGWLDSPLSALGIRQAKAAAEELRDTHIDAAYCSDAGRARRTAEIICEPHALIPVPVEALRERFYGGYEGLNTHEIEQQYPGTRYKAKRDTREDWRPPQGETMVEVRTRLKAFLDEAAHRHAGETVLMVTHSGVVRALDSICCGLTLDDIWHRAPGNCSIFIVRAHEGDYEVLRDFHDLETTA